MAWPYPIYGFLRARIGQKLTKTLDEYQRGALRSSADNI